MRTAYKLLLAAAGLATAWYVSKHTWLAPEPVAVRTAAVERGRVEESVTNSKAGTVEARRRAKLSPAASGIAAELAVKRGQRVARGEMLLRLEDTSQRAQVALAERALDVARAQHAKACLAGERARREYERNRALETQKVVSADVLDALASTRDLALAECAVLDAEVQRATAAVEAARAELDKTVLRAPFDAIVAEVPIELGEWATPSVPRVVAPDVIDVIDPSSIYVSAPMDEVDTGRLLVGLAVRVTLDAFPGRSFPARVARLAPYVSAVEQQNRTQEVEVELDDSGFASALLPGLSADVEIVLSVRENALRVPSSALLEGGRVLVLADGGLVERHVRVGVRNWDWTEVLEGLEPGERVVTTLEREQVAPGARARDEGSGAQP
jgi:HlyD family secretion protein